MALYEYECLDCEAVFETRIPMSEASESGEICPVCGEMNTRKVYASVAYSMPGAKSEDSWNAWYEGKEAAVGMSRERTQQLARHVYQQTKGNVTPVAPKRSISTPGNPSPHQQLPE